MVDVLQTLNLFTSNPVVITFLAAFIAGDGAILSLAFISGAGFMPIWIVFIFAFLATIIKESAFYFIGKKEIKVKINSPRWIKHHKRAHKFILKHSRGNIFLLILLSKFVYGTRILTSIYSGTRISYKKFLTLNSISNTIHILLLIFIGYFAGSGFHNFAYLLSTAKFWVTAIVIIFAILTIIRLMTHHAIKRHYKHKE